jgi:membrane protein
VATVTVLFAMLYKWLPNVPIAWLGGNAITSAYGAAGTPAVPLLWLYYSAQVFLLGAEFTYVFADHRRDARRRHSSLKREPVP